MAVITNWYTMDNKSGVDLNYVQSSVTTTNDPSVPGPRAKLGDRVQGNNGSEWIFCIASATVTQYNCVAIGTGYAATNINSTIVASMLSFYGFAQFQSTVANTGDYFWALLKADNGVGLRASPSVQAGAFVFLSFNGNSGSFTSSVTSDAIMGIEVLASISVSADSPTEARVFTYILPALNMLVAGATV